MGNLDDGLTTDGSVLNQSAAQNATTATEFNQEEHDMLLHKRKFSSPAYTEIRTRNNGLKANGVTMSANGFKVKSRRR